MEFNTFDCDRFETREFEFLNHEAAIESLVCLVDQKPLQFFRVQITQVEIDKPGK